MEPVNFRMKGDVEGLPPNLQLPPALRQGRPGDPFQCTRPALRDLQAPESIRVLAVIDESIWRVDLVTALDKLSRNRKTAVAVEGADEETMNLLEAHFNICCTVDGLRSRSEVIARLTSYQLRDIYFKEPTFSFRDLEVTESSLELYDESSMSVVVAETSLQVVPWGMTKVELVSSDVGSDEDSITNIKREMLGVEPTSKKAAKAVKRDSEELEVSDLSLPIQWSEVDVDVAEQDEEDGDDGDASKGPVSAFYQIERQDPDFEALVSTISESLTGSAGDGDSIRPRPLSSQPWGSIQQLDDYSLYDVVTESFQKKTIVASLKLVEKQLAMVVRNILRAFGRNPAVLDKVLADKQRTDPSQEFLSQLRDLRDSLRMRLLTTPGEERKKAKHMAEVLKAIAAYEALIGRLESEIKKVTDDKIAKCREMNDKIRKLHLDMATVEKLGEEYNERTRQEGEKKRAVLIRQSQERRQRPLQDLAEFNAKLSKIRHEHWESEAHLRRKRYKIETEIDNWVKRYDEDMTALQEEYDEVEAAYAIEKKALEEMEDKFEPMEADFKKIMEERELLYEERMFKEREELRRMRSVRAIQAWWREFRVKKAIRIKYIKLEKARLKALKKKGKKGKKGKGAKPKGKK